MDLAQQLSGELGLDQRTSEAVLGTVFTSIRMSVDAATFSRVIKALPDAEHWMHQIPMGEGRTGEIVSLAGADGLRRQLRMMGLADPQIAQAGAAVGRVLRERLPRAAVEKVIQRVSLLE